MPTLQSHWKHPSLCMVCTSMHQLQADGWQIRLHNAFVDRALVNLTYRNIKESLRPLVMACRHLVDLPWPHSDPTWHHTMSDSIRIPDSIDLQRLQAMQLVAKMKESADKHGVGFIGGFIAPNGEKFIMSNLDDEDSQALLPDNLKWQQWNYLFYLLFWFVFHCSWIIYFTND